MEVLAPIFEKFGPTGLTIIMMGGGLVYLTRWLRQMSDADSERYDRLQERFLESLDKQRQENHASLSQVVAEFKSMHSELGERVDNLSDKVDALRDR